MPLSSTCRASASAGSLLSTEPPRAGIAEAQAIARAHFGLTAAARLLTSERDLNFHLTGGDGRDYVLKITNAAEDRAVTDLQTRALLHVARRRPALVAPRLVRTLGGEPDLTLNLAGSWHVVRLLTFLEGVPVHATESSRPQRRALGRFLAEFGKALEDFDHPAADHELPWDLKHAGRLDALTAHIGDGALQSLARHAFAYFRDHVEPLQASLRAQVVHNDFQPHNVLVDPAAPDRVAGVIDFGDVVRTPLVNDLAVAASYQLPEGDAPLAGAAEFVAAYHEVRPLEEREVDLLFDLIAVRHAMTVTITEWRASRYPENRAYILRNHPRAARGLRLFAETPRNRGRSAFRHACGME